MVGVFTFLMVGVFNSGSTVIMLVSVGLNGASVTSDAKSWTPVLRNWLAKQQSTVGLAHF
jgi:hypothetical protein